MKNKKTHKKKSSKKKTFKKIKPRTINLRTERDIAMDFGAKVYKKFDKLVKSIILFGSSSRHTTTSGSDIDIIIIIDDASIKFDDKLIFWYREELGKIIKQNPYQERKRTITLGKVWIVINQLCTT